MAEKAICNVCGKEVKLVITFSIAGREPTKPICQKCFDRATTENLKRLKGEKMAQTAKQEIENVREATKSKSAKVTPIEKNTPPYIPPASQSGEICFDSKISELVDKTIKSMTEFNWLIGRGILVVTKENLGKKAAKIRRSSDYEKLLAPIDVVLTISNESWDGLSDNQKKSLIMHELCHLSQNEDGEIEMVDHDVEEFLFILGSRGAWNDTLIKAKSQLELFASGNKPQHTPKCDKNDDYNDNEHDKGESD